MVWLAVRPFSGWRYDCSGFQSLVRYIGNGRVLGVPVLVIIVAIACLIMHYLLSQTRFGQHYAMGASKCGQPSGINIKKLTMKIYLLGGHGRHCRGPLFGPLFGGRGAGGRTAAA